MYLLRVHCIVIFAVFVFYCIINFVNFSASLSPPSRNTSPLEDQKFNSFTHGFEKKSKKTPNTLLPFHVQDVDPNITAQSTKVRHVAVIDILKRIYYSIMSVLFSFPSFVWATKRRNCWQKKESSFLKTCPSQRRRRELSNQCDERSATRCVRRSFWFLCQMFCYEVFVVDFCEGESQAQDGIRRRNREEGEDWKHAQRSAPTKKPDPRTEKPDAWAKKPDARKREPVSRCNLGVWDCRWNNKIQTSTACVLLTECTYVFVVLIWKFFDKRLTQLLCLIDFSTCSNDNQNNWTLPRVFRSLKSTVKTLQMLLATGSNKTAQTSTCVMVLLLSFALLVIPNVDPFGANSSNDDVKLSSKETHFAGLTYYIM